MHVAVVDDRESSHAGYTQILRRLPDVEPVCFAKVDEALDWLRSSDAAFVVIDAGVGDGGGLDLVRRMRQIPGRQNTPVIVTSAKADRDLRRSSFELDAYAFLEKPINPTELLTVASHIVRGAVMRAGLERRLAETVERARSIVQTTDTVAQEPDELVISAMRAVAAHHDPSIVAHLDLASQLTRALCRQLKLSDEEVETMAKAARIYDIGKVAIPQRILTLRERATGPDRITIELHAEAGARLLLSNQSTTMKTAATMAHTHHERFDGTGYPRKLRGTAIPLGGRVVAVADVITGMLRTRGDRPPHTLGEAMTFVEQNAGILFDPGVASALRTGISDVSRVVHEAQNPQTA